MFSIEASSLHLNYKSLLRVLHNLVICFTELYLHCKKYIYFFFPIFQLEFAYFQLLIIRSWNAFNILWNICSPLKTTF